MLTDTEAAALLTKYWDPLRITSWIGFDFSRRHHWTDAVRQDVELIVRARSDGTEDGGHLAGAQLRLALGVAQAMSYCRGFEPHTNPAFWRRVIITRRVHVCPLQYARERFGFSQTMFDHVGLEVLPLDSDGPGFWRGFLHGTRECDAALTSVLARLRPYFAWGFPPPLRVSLSHCYSSTIEESEPRAILEISPPVGYFVSATVSPSGLEDILHGALDVPQPKHTCVTPDVWTATTTQLGLVLHYGVEYDTARTRQTLELLERALALRLPHLILTVDRLDVRLVPLGPPWSAHPDLWYRRVFVERGRALGAMLHALLVDRRSACRVSTVTLLGCSHGDFRLVCATLSAVAYASFPVEALRGVSLFDARQPHEKLLRLAWLVYTLRVQHQLRRSPWSVAVLSLGEAIDEREREYIQQLEVHGTPLRDVVGEALRLWLGGDDDEVGRLRSVECLPFGSTVRLVWGARLLFEPTREGEEGEAGVATTLGGEDGDRQLDVVARVMDDRHGAGGGGCDVVGLVLAGFGLVWTDTANVVSWHHVVGSDYDEREAKSAVDDGDSGGDVTMSDATLEPTDGSLVTSLVLAFESVENGQVSPAYSNVAHRVSGLLPLLTGAALTSLSLDRAVVLREDLVHLLGCSPGLRVVLLDQCVVESVEPLLELYTNGTSRSGTTRRRRGLSSLSLNRVVDLRYRNQLIPESYLLDAFSTSGVREEDGSAPLWLASLVDILASGATRGVLHELRLDVSWMASECEERATLKRLAQAVASSALTLRRLDVTCRYTLMPACEGLLGPLRDVVIADAPDLVRLAVVSGLRVHGCAVREIVDAVLALSESGVRTVTWTFYLT